MIPSRGLIQVNLDDPDVRAGSCNQPVTQVKILRRPKPSTDYSIDNDSSRPNPGAVRPNIADKKPIVNETSIFSEDQWPSIADAAKCSRSQTNKSNSSPRELLPPSDPAPKELKIISKNNQIQQQTANKKPMPIKSYKERADEYAKARLRILGSACSEKQNSDRHKP